MFGLGLPEIIIILIVALLVVGPSKLPELARSLGKAFNDFKRMAEDVKDTFSAEVDEIKELDPTNDIRKEVDEIKELDPTHDIRREVDEIRNLDVTADTATPSTSQNSIPADGKESERSDATSQESHVSPPQHAEADKLTEQSGKNDPKAV